MILGTIATYSCAEGYTGDNQHRTCVHNGDEAITYGTWTTETIPTCTSKIDISNIRILNEYIYIYIGMSLSFSCAWLQLINCRLIYTKLNSDLG